MPPAIPNTFDIRRAIAALESEIIGPIERSFIDLNEAIEERMPILSSIYLDSLRGGVAAVCKQLLRIRSALERHDIDVVSSATSASPEGELHSADIETHDIGIAYSVTSASPESAGDSPECRLRSVSDGSVLAASAIGATAEQYRDAIHGSLLHWPPKVDREGNGLRMTGGPVFCCGKTVYATCHVSLPLT